MSKKKRSTTGEHARRRQPYRPPKLTVHGDIRTLTRAKAGTKGDGTGKPATRTSGGQT